MAHAKGPLRTALLTGAAGGIGNAIALALAGEGWQLLLTDRDAAALDETRRQCEALGCAVAVRALDVTCEDQVAAAVQYMLARHGRLDGFVSNAGVPGVVQPIAEYPLDVFARTLAVNTTGTFLCLKYALPAMRAAGGGSFVAIGSTSSIRGRAGLPGYVASKHAVLGLVRSAALETVGTGVRVNAVLPGPTQTAMIDAINAMARHGAEGSDAEGGAGSDAGGDTGRDARSNKSGGQIQRAVAAPYGQPSDVADTVAFLLSSRARHMNGAALVVDGGSTIA